MLSRIKPLCFARPDSPGGGSPARPEVKGVRLNEALVRASRQTIDIFTAQGRPAVPTKILLLEDDKNLRIDLQQGIEQAGAADRAALLPEKSLGASESSLAAMILRESYDCLVMDADLCGTDGVKLTRLLREQGFRGWIIANSSQRNRALLAAGADLAPGNFKTSLLTDFFQL
jgi:CheY-like chemotaxis protein